MKSIVIIVLCGVLGIFSISMAAYVDPTGTVEGRIKIYSKSCEQNEITYTHDQVDIGDVTLFDEDGDKIDSDSVNSRGEFKFEDVKADKKYFIKCEADGYVSAENPSEVKYISGKFDVDADETTTENCMLLSNEKLNCTEPIASTITPECGTANKTYRSDETDFEGNFCKVGENDTEPTFPKQGSQISWSCMSGSVKVQCIAAREKTIAPVIQGSSDPVPTQKVSDPSKEPETIIPLPSKKVIINDPEPVVYHATAAAGLVTGTVIAFATSAVPLFATMPMAAKDLFIMPFIGLLARRKNERKWGTVFEQTTKQPIPGVKLVLIDAQGTEVETAYSDQHGRFGFLTTNGTYLMQPQKAKFKENYEHDIDPLYGETYTGEQIEMDENKVIITNIAMNAVDVDWQVYAQQKAKSYTGLFSTIRKWGFLTIFYAGFIATAVITYHYPSVLNFVFLVLYATLFIYDNFIKKRKYGTVNTNEKKPVSFAIVSLHDKDTNEKKNFAVTDVIGRYYLLAENGIYNMKVKGQPVGGQNFEKQGEVHVREGLVRKDMYV